MSFVVRIAAALLGILLLVVTICVCNLRCSGDLEQDLTVRRIKGDIAAGKREAKVIQADNLAEVARDLRVLARRYKEKGESKKAQRAISAAMELDKKIRQLRGD